jgi:hypothetical protein
LLCVGETGRLPRLVSSLREDREQYGCQDGDYSYNNEEFDQRECSGSSPKARRAGTSTRINKSKFLHVSVFLS